MVGGERGHAWQTVNQRAVRILLECILVTTRKRSLGQGNVYRCVPVHRGGGVWSQGGACSGDLVPQKTPPDGYCCGRYASYWNVFLSSRCLQNFQSSFSTSTDMFNKFSLTPWSRGPQSSKGVERLHHSCNHLDPDGNLAVPV